MKNKKIISLILVGLLMISVLTGCGQVNDTFNAVTGSSDGLFPEWNNSAVEGGVESAIDSISDGGGYNSGFSNSYESSYTKSESSSSRESSEYTEILDSANSDTSNGDNTDIEGSTNNTSALIAEGEKLVFTSYLTLETKEFDSSLDFLRKKVNQLGGFIESEKLTNTDRITANKEKYARYSNTFITVRIPQKNYQVLLDTIDSKQDLFWVNSLSSNVENFTTVYADLETKIKSLQVMQDRYFTYLANAKDVSEMLLIETKISNTQYELDSLINKKNGIDRDVSYSTIHIELHEVKEYSVVEEEPEEDTFFVRLKGYFKKSFNDFADTVENILEQVIYELPTIIIWAVILILLFVYLKKKKISIKEKVKELFNSDSSIKKSNKVTLQAIKLDKIEDEEVDNDFDNNTLDENE